MTLSNENVDLWVLVDDLLETQRKLDEQYRLHIEQLEQRKKLLKEKIEREMEDRGIEEVLGNVGRAIRVKQERKSVDMNAVCEKYAITKSDLALFTKINNVKYAKISERKFTS